MLTLLKEQNIKKGASQLYSNWDSGQREPFRVPTLVNKSHKVLLSAYKNQVHSVTTKKCYYEWFLVKSSEKF